MNMKNKTFFLGKIIFLLFVIFIVFTGCSQKKPQPSPQQQSQTENQSDKVPDQLKNIENNIEKIFTVLEAPSTAPEGETKKGTQQQEDSKGSQQGQSSPSPSSSASSSPSASPSASSSPSPSPQPSQATQKDKWTEVLSTVHNLHFEWNDYIPSAASKGANRTLVDNFSNALNTLTNNVMNKNKTGTLLASNALSAYIPDFYQLYKTNTSPEIKRIKSYARSAILNSMTSNWTQAELDINSLKSSWSMYKNTVSNEQRNDVNKLEYSLNELEKVLKEKNQPLTDIKGRVTLSNISSIESTAEKEQEKSGKSGQGK